MIDSSDLTLYINALVDETLCPPGKLVVMAIAPNLEPWPAPGSRRPLGRVLRTETGPRRSACSTRSSSTSPVFASHIETLIVGTPTTIERYLLKNGGAVGGPKNAIGQQMLKRLHARSEWKNLYLCGDSTVMATGAPATAVSGVGAANMVLRDLRKPEYDARVSAPVRRIRRHCPTAARPSAETNRSRWRTRRWPPRQCQGCEDPACVR